MKRKCTLKHVRLFSSVYFSWENNEYVRHIDLISPCEYDNAKSLVIFMESIWGTYIYKCPSYLEGTLRTAPINLDWV